MGVTGFYRRLWNHLCFSVDVYISRYHQNRQTLSANTRVSRLNVVKNFVRTAFTPSLAA
jgi:hypothetical protein